MRKNLTCSPIEAAYIAGFFDGEGSIARRDGRISITQKDPAPLYWIQKKLGCGSVLKRSGDSYRYGLSGKKRTYQFLMLILPYLIVKRQRALEECGFIAETTLI
jgi:hypothetical protein